MRPKPNTDGMFRILWPEKKLVTAETLILWASDDVNEAYETDDYKVSDVEEALDVLLETGSVTFARNA